MTNPEIADALDAVADLLAAQRSNPFRVRAYRGAAEVVRKLERPVAELLAASDGLAALDALPGIGTSLARTIAELAETGRLGLLERLRGRAAPDARLATVAGIGPLLARRVHDRLGIETLEELEAAAHDGRLGSVTGFGPRRVRGVAESLAGRLGRRSADRSAGPRSAAERPSVADLLDVDREYREKAAAGALERIAPRRFNPQNEAWLPVLHTERGGRHYTALFSNTARAHELGKTRDWVVIFADDGRGERQATVVTETHGPLEGRRVVRGRESECGAADAGGGRPPRTGTG